MSNEGAPDPKKTALGTRPGRPADRARSAEIERLKATTAGAKVRLNANVPGDLYARYKAAVERRGLTVTTAVVQHMHDFLEAYE